MTRKIRIGSRGSKLSLWQANLVKSEIEKHFASIRVMLRTIQTEGDRDQVSSLTQIGGKGVFTKTIEKALIDDKIDLAPRRGVEELERVASTSVQALYEL